MVTHSSKALPQEGIHVVKPKPALQTPKEREAEERKKGNDYFQQGNFQKAIKAYTACLGISNRSVLAFSNRAMCWLKLKEWRKAEMDATLALQVEISFYLSIYYLSIYYLSISYFFYLYL
mmetsp:Transcript_15488/g.20098  ORF Transcript_15488/g.20098 Transcript_15488/m.20098 type:complete len:120 (+) Transcript_15488:830-1189(+)